MLAEFGVDDESQAAAEAAAELRHQKQMAAFDRLCEQNRITPGLLAMKSESDLVAMLLEIGMKDVSGQVAVAAVENYAKTTARRHEAG